MLKNKVMPKKNRENCCKTFRKRDHGQRFPNVIFGLGTAANRLMGGRTQKPSPLKIQIDEKIELKQLERSDTKDIFRTIDSQREYLGRWLPFVEYTREIADTEKFVDSVINAPEGRFEYVFVIKKGDEFVGLIGFKDTDKQNRKTEIGYWLSEKHQKQGIVTKAVEALCGYAFEKLNINRVQIKCAIGNTSSGNIPRRLGFSLEGIERQGELLTGNAFTDLKIYSKLKSDVE